MGYAGFDLVWIDLEHTHISCKEALCHLNAARSAGISSMIRVTQDDLTVTKKILEMSPDSILFPMVRSAKEVNKLIDMTLYPPYGTRGFGPIRAIRYGADDAKEYVDKTSFEMCRFVQIEHIDFIDELEEIVKNPYIDGYIFGPNDLSGSVGEMLDVYSEKTVSQINRAIDILKKHDKCFGIACGADESVIEFWAKFNPDILVAGADWNYVYQTGCDTLKKIKKHLDKKLFKIIIVLSTSALGDIL